jgi:hypothetical protein
MEWSWLQEEAVDKRKCQLAKEDKNKWSQLSMC